MRKMIALFCCLLAFIGFVSLIHIQLKKDVTWAIDQAAEVTNTIEQPSRSQEAYQNLETNWNEKVYWWGMVLPHDNLQEINKEIKKLGAAAKQQNKEDAALAVSSLDSAMNELLDRNTLRLDHIL